MKRLFNIIFIVSLFSFSGCCELNNGLEQAELFIKEVQQLYDYFGNPIYNTYTGQPVTAELPNALFYNERTGEYFNPEFGSVLPTVVGDVIQFASIVTNAARNLAKCDDLTTALPSQTKMPLNFTFPDGATQTYSLIGMTPSIAPNGAAYGAGRFQITGPGFINVDEVETDFDDSVKEFNENNNITQIGIATSVGGRVNLKRPIISVSASIEIKPSNYEGVCQLSVIGNMQDMGIFRNMNKSAFSNFISRVDESQRRQSN